MCAGGSEVVVASDISSILASINRMERGEIPTSIAARETGYQIDTDGVSGVSLLSPRQHGYHLIMRIKQSQPFLWDEARFWGTQMARVVDGLTFDLVTHPPSSRKRDEHFATLLAQEVAKAIDAPYAELFTNVAPRGRRANAFVKLTESKAYGYQRQPDGAKVLVVDDVMYTRSTAHACLAACGSDQLFFLILYRA